MKTAVIAGASGLVGGHLLRILLETPDYSGVWAVVRRPLGVKHPKLREAPFAALEAREGLPRAEDVFCCLGTTIAKAGSRAAFRAVDYELPLALARWAKRAGAGRFLLVTSGGADPKSRIFYSRTKGELEKAIAALALPSLEVFRPSLLLGEREEERPGERVAQAVLPWLSPLLVGPLRNVRAIKAETVARAMLKVARSKERGALRVHESSRIEELGA